MQLKYNSGYRNNKTHWKSIRSQKRAENIDVWFGQDLNVFISNLSIVSNSAVLYPNRFSLFGYSMFNNKKDIKPVKPVWSILHSELKITTSSLTRNNQRRITKKHLFSINVCRVSLFLFYKQP